MKRVLLMTHRGIRCAVPAEQAVDIVGGTEVDIEIDLWTGHVEGLEASHAVRVATRDGLRLVRCSDPRLTEMQNGSFGPLPELIRDVMALPHVVGTAQINGALVWLVDVKRFSPANTQQEAS